MVHRVGCARSSAVPVSIAPCCVHHNCPASQIVELKRAHPGVLLVIEVGYKYRFYGGDAVAGGPHPGGDPALLPCWRRPVRHLADGSALPPSVRPCGVAAPWSACQLAPAQLGLHLPSSCPPPAASRILGIYSYQDRSFLSAGVPQPRLHVHIRRLVEAGHKASAALPCCCGTEHTAAASSGGRGSGGGSASLEQAANTSCALRMSMPTGPSTA